MKRCTTCELLKPPDEFSVGQGRCKQCRNESKRRQHITPAQKAARTAKMKQRTEELVQWMNWLKTLIPCANCGEPMSDWDHLPGTDKVDAVSKLIWTGRVQAVLQEMQKCQPLCRSCHTKLSISRKQVTFGRSKS